MLGARGGLYKVHKLECTPTLYHVSVLLFSQRNSAHIGAFFYMQNSSDVLNQLRTFQSGRRKPQDVLGEAENRLGLPTARQRLAGLRTAIGNTENLLRNVEPSVAGRTAGSLVTDAQRTKLVSNERAPISEQFREESRALEGETGNIADLSQRSLSEAQLGLSADDAQETGLRSLYGSLYQREQDEVQRQERERAFQEELRKNRAAQAAQNAYLQYIQNQQAQDAAATARRKATEPTKIYAENGVVHGYDAPHGSFMTDEGWKREGESFNEQTRQIRGQNAFGSEIGSAADVLGKYGPMALLGQGWLWR